MFLGREKELHKLDSLYHSNKFEMAVFYGRIHVGKTTLLSHFVKDKPCIFMYHNICLYIKSFLKHFIAFMGWLNENGSFLSLMNIHT